MKRLVILLILLSFFPLFSQEAEEEVQDLFAETIYSDINTASYYELLNWCRELELDTKGNSDSLKRQLYSHYGVDLNSIEEQGDENAIVVKIVTADRTEYYTVDQISEDYVRISGRVKLIVKQVSKNTTHTIEADSVLFNQTTDTMTASGNIVYTKEENGKEEEYSGDNFTFNVQNWKGVILKGDFKRTQEVGEQEMEFIFSGEAIKKGEGDVVVLDQGAITSCETDEPHYRIKARKIWILGPDEWAILNGALYIGHIPILYIPFYHLPGNDLFFNPVMGDDSRRGYFIQTTTYLLGQKSGDDEDDSFFINLADSDDSYKLVPEGLYLFKEKGTSDDSSGSDYIKYKLDYYSRLGGYTALEGSLAKLWEFRNIYFDLGVGVTRTIYGDGSGYSNFFPENDFLSSWNSSDLFGVSLPFRWGLSFGFSLLTFNAKFEYLADPYFKSDFAGREENFDWLNYLLSQTTEEEDVEESSQSSLTWSLDGSVNVPNQWAGDYIRNLSFSSIKMNLLWNSKENSDYSLPGDPSIPYDPYGPGRMFFYPANITWPQTSLNLSGVFLEYRSGEGEPIPEDELEKRDQINPPWRSGSDEVITESEDEETELEKPERFDEIVLEDNAGTFYTKIDYSLTGYLNMLSYTNSDLWNTPSEVDFDILKSVLTNKNTFILNYNIDYSEKMISLIGKNTFVTDYLDYFGDFSSEEGLSESKGRKLNWTNTLDFSLSPLKNIPYLGSSSIRYDFDAKLFSYNYDTETGDYRDDWISWDKDYITDHKAGATLDFSIPYITLATTFDTTLPPVDFKQTISPSFTFNLWKWSSTVSGKIKYEESEWTPEPLTISTSFTPLEKVGLTGNFTYSFEEEVAKSLSTTLNLWFFSGTFSMSHETDWEWDKDLQTLEDMGKDFIADTLKLGIDYKYETPLLWKNRISMDGQLKLDLNLDLQQYNLTSLDFTLKYNLHIFEFMDLRFSMKSSNDYMFLYFPGIRDYYGITDEYSFFQDLFKSFNFFSPDQQDRYESFFNMDTLDISLVHKLHDWDLELTYSGKPVLDEGEFESRWDSSFSILVRWNPIEKLKVKTDYANELLNVDTEF